MASGSELPRYFDHDELRGDSLRPWQQHLSKIFIPVAAAQANVEIHCARPRLGIAKIAIRRRCSDPSTTQNSAEIHCGNPSPTRRSGRSAIAHHPRTGDTPDRARRGAGR
jgi:hypothetical protein